MVTQTHCPEPDVIRQLLRGQVPETKHGQLATHLELCPDCRDRFESEASHPEFMTDAAPLCRTKLSGSESASLDRLIETLPQQLSSVSDVAAIDEWSVESVRDLLESSNDPNHIGRLDDYEIIEIVGRGGMGIVLRGVDPKLNRVVAIKLLAPELASNPNARKRFFREAQAAAAVSHDHVVTIHAVSDDARLPYLVMEYINGESLEDLVRREGSLSVETILRIGRQIAVGLAAAHEVGLVHRDMKPANILLENGIQKVCITDFGLARAVDDVSMTRTGVVAGTPLYMSPEQADGKAVDHRSDLFSVGSVLYTMCTGRPAFRAESTPGVLKRVCHDEPRPIREVNPEIPEWLSDIISRLMTKDREQRIQNATDLAELFGSHLAHLRDPQNVASPKPLTAAGGDDRARRPRWLLLCLLALIPILTITEAVGVTGVVEYLGIVLKLRTPNGTLVVEIEDPNVKVSVDGDEVVVDGVGVHELRLKPGKHKWETERNGHPSKTEWVTIERGGKTVLKVQQLPPEKVATEQMAGPPIPARDAPRMKELLLQLMEAEAKAKSTVVVDFAKQVVANAKSKLSAAQAQNEKAKRSGDDAIFSAAEMQSLKLDFVKANAELEKAIEDKELARLRVQILRSAVQAGHASVAEHSNVVLRLRLAEAETKATSKVLIDYATNRKEHAAERLSAKLAEKKAGVDVSANEINELKLSLVKATAELEKAIEDREIAALTAKKLRVELGNSSVGGKVEPQAGDSPTGPTSTVVTNSIYRLRNGAIRPPTAADGVIAKDGLAIRSHAVLGRISKDAFVEGPNGMHRFPGLPEQLEGQRTAYLRDKSGVLEAFVERTPGNATQRVWLLICMADWNDGAPTFGRPFDTHQSMLEDGWQQSVTLLSAEANEARAEYEWNVYYRDVKGGEHFQVRVNEHRSPLLVWGSLDLGRIEVEPQWDQRVAKFVPGASLPLGNGQLTFPEVPVALEGRLYTKRNGYAGISRFRVLEDQQVYMGLYDWRFTNDGNDSGGWREELTTPDKLAFEGWTKVMDLSASHSDPATKPPTIHIYSRTCKAGEKFAIRNHKYQAPIVFGRRAGDAADEKPDVSYQQGSEVELNLETSTEGLVGRASVEGDDGRVVFHYQHGHFFDRSHLPESFRDRSFTVSLTGYLAVPKDMSLRVYQAGGGVSHDVNQLYVNHRSLGMTGDNRDKHLEQVLHLRKGLHHVRWVLKGGTFRSNILAFVDASTREMLRLVNPGIEAVRLDGSDRYVNINGRKQDWPVPHDWLPNSVRDVWMAEPLDEEYPLEKPLEEPVPEKAAPVTTTSDKNTIPSDLPYTADSAIALINELGGSVSLIESIAAPDTNIVVGVNLRSTDVTDADLLCLLALPHIESLELSRTKVTSAGLVPLKHLKRLKSLSLYNTAVDDAGLKHLRASSRLEFLVLKRTEVTQQGVEMLQPLMPHCLISWSPR